MRLVHQIIRPRSATVEKPARRPLRPRTDSHNSSPRLGDRTDSPTSTTVGSRAVRPTLCDQTLVLDDFSQRPLPLYGRPTACNRCLKRKQFHITRGVSLNLMRFGLGRAKSSRIPRISLFTTAAAMSQIAGPSASVAVETELAAELLQKISPEEVEAGTGAQEVEQKWCRGESPCPA